MYCGFQRKFAGDGMYLIWSWLFVEENDSFYCLLGVVVCCGRRSGFLIFQIVAFSNFQTLKKLKDILHPSKSIKPTTRKIHWVSICFNGIYWIKIEAPFQGENKIITFLKDRYLLQMLNPSQQPLTKTWRFYRDISPTQTDVKKTCQHIPSLKLT